MSRVSVVIPCFNRASCIGWTLESVLRQSRPPDEVIVVDDGSTDHSAEVVRKFGDQVRFIEQANQGPGAARNRGLDASSGDYVWFMDSDDLASRNQLEVQLKAVEGTGADLAYGPWIRSRIDQSGITFLGPVLQARALPPERSMLEWQLGPWSTVFQACLFRRDALEKAGRYHTDMRVAEDGEYLVRILAAGASSVFVGGSLLFYRSEGIDQLTHSQGQEVACRNALDHTRYFECLGETLGSQEKTLPITVERALALQVFRHNRYCAGIGVEGVPGDNAVMGLLDRTGRYTLLLLDCLDRIIRRIGPLADNVPRSKGMQCRKPTQLEMALASKAWAQCRNEPAAEE